MEPPQHPAQQPGKSIGRGMMIAGWLIVLALLTWVFGNWEESRYNPNQNVATTSSGGQVEVSLQRNRWGHYVANGTINGKTVTYLLDTGATDVSIPGHLEKKLGLSRGRSFNASTANGIIQVYGTTLDTFTLGGIEMRNVRASINPHMKANEILLGMSVLQHLELVQKGDSLTIRQ
ncbi:TIGR02281 family clan AA aspartic protease [Porticoccus sp. W117]|uniref:retropepsin-like aspartic protease family protein n=1 Tax=Porticoccus sp. W117 TaxID=3054777 RepID=UPI002593E9CE|nr:TIGR02281 family clan AA aspartic protease [Porticoccus sp. W117]MDM3871995.1 TIGR02281 family clan AA aspartic protease [Porticoccus sp. W117]